MKFELLNKVSICTVERTRFEKITFYAIRRDNNHYVTSYKNRRPNSTARNR